MASRWPLLPHTSTLTVHLHIPREGGFATQQTKGTVEYDDSFKKAKCPGEAMKENIVHVERMIARAEIQSARSKYQPSLGPTSHPSPLRVLVQRGKYFQS